MREFGTKIDHKTNQFEILGYKVTLLYGDKLPDTGQKKWCAINYCDLINTILYQVEKKNTRLPPQYVDGDLGIPIYNPCSINILPGH